MASVVIARMRGSAVRLNSIAEIGHPCLTPAWMGIGGVSPSGVWIVVVESS